MRVLKIPMAFLAVAILALPISAHAFGWGGSSGGGSGGASQAYFNCLSKPTPEEKQACIDALKKLAEQQNKDAAEKAGMKIYGFKFGAINFKDVPEDISGFKIICAVFGGEPTKTIEEAHAEIGKVTPIIGNPSSTDVLYSYGVNASYIGYFDKNPVRRMNSSVTPDDLDAASKGNVALTPKNWGCGIMMTKDYTLNKDSGKSSASDAYVGGADAPIGGASKVWVVGPTPVSLGKTNEVNVGKDTAPAGDNNKPIEVPKGIKFP